MNRLLTCTALGLVLGLSPALAQQPADDTQSPPAVQQPVIPEVMPSEPSLPSDPAAPIPGDSSDISPAQPGPAMPQSSEVPLSIEPAAPRAAELSGGTQFLMKQATSDYLASNLIGKTVYNSQDESIGDVNDLVTDAGGKVVAVLIGHGGFLGMGEKDVAIRFEDLKLTRDENNDIKVISNLDKDTLASAPDFERLSEQNLAVGSSDRDDRNDRGASETN
jgi:sporulation protein YlmC with PRC-barrel domain